MADSPTTTSQNNAIPTTDVLASAVNKTVGDILNGLIPTVEAAIIAAEPWMATPGLKQIWEECLQLIVNQINDALGPLASNITMDVQEFIRVKAALSSLSNLQAAIKSGDPNAVTQANSSADSALAPIVHYIGDGRAS